MLYKKFFYCLKSSGCVCNCCLYAGIIYETLTCLCTCTNTSTDVPGIRFEFPSVGIPGIPFLRTEILRKFRNLIRFFGFLKDFPGILENK